MEEQTENHEEHTIILLKDMQLPAHIREAFENSFFCPKCDSSLIFLPDRYAKNNLINSLEVSSEMPEKANENWERIIMQCDCCNYTDLIIKFLKKRASLWNEPAVPGLLRPSNPNRYYTPMRTTTGITGTSGTTGTTGAIFSSPVKYISTASKKRKLWQNTI